MRIKLKRNQSSASDFPVLEAGEPLWFKDQLYIGSVGTASSGDGTEGELMQIANANYLYDGYLFPNALTDNDGNRYGAVIIGNQVWLASNYRCKTFRDGTPIEYGGGAPTEFSDTIPYWSYPGNNNANFASRGLLYNNAAVLNGENPSSSNPSGVQGIAPDNWHVPSLAEWKQLNDYVKKNKRYLADPSAANSTAKALCSRWYWNETDSTLNGKGPGYDRKSNNATGLSLRGTGRQQENGFTSVGAFGSYATCTEYSGTSMHSMYLKFNFNFPYIGDSDYIYPKGCSNALRLVSDFTPQEFLTWYRENFNTIQYLTRQKITANSEAFDYNATIDIQDGRYISVEPDSTTNTITVSTNVSDGYVFPNAVQDGDGNWYDAVTIGDQVWLTENLRAIHYSDGTTEVARGAVGTYSSDSALWCIYNTTNYHQKYGKLYNWKAAMGSDSASSANPSGVQGLAPIGWHIPSQAEFQQLIDYVKSQSRYPSRRSLATNLSGMWTTTSSNIIGTNLTLNNGTGFNAKANGCAYSGYATVDTPLYSTTFITSTEDDNDSSKYYTYNFTYSAGAAAWGAFSSRDKSAYSGIRCVCDLDPTQFRAWYVNKYGGMQHIVKTNTDIILANDVSSSTASPSLIFSRGSIDVINGNDYIDWWMKATSNGSFQLTRGLLPYAADTENASSAVNVITATSSSITTPCSVESAGFKVTDHIDSNKGFLRSDGTVDENTYALASAFGSYLPLAGGSETSNLMTGPIFRKFTNAADSPMICMASGNYDNWLWRIKAADVDGETPYPVTSQAYGFGAKYHGAGSGNNNSYQFWADNQTGEAVKAIEIFQDGKMTIAADVTVNAGVTASGSVTAGSFVKTGGTSSQFLKADGSVDTNSYALASAIPTVNNATLTLAGGGGLTVSADPTFTANASTNKTITITHPSGSQNASGFYKITTNDTGHVTAASAVTATDITGLVGTHAGGTQVTLNGNGGGANADVSIYAPVGSGTTGQYLKSNGENAAPTWTSFDTEISEVSTNAVQNKAVGTELVKLWDKKNIASRLNPTSDAGSTAPSSAWQSSYNTYYTCYINSYGEWVRNGSWGVANSNITEGTNTYAGKHTILPLTNIRKVGFRRYRSVSSGGTVTTRRSAIAFLKSYTPPTSETLPVSEFATGTSIISNNTDTVNWYDVPNDAVWLYVWTWYGSDGNHFPNAEFLLTGIGITEYEGTGSGFVKDDGTVDTSTYALASAIPTNVSDLQNDANYIEGPSGSSKEDILTFNNTAGNSANDSGISIRRLWEDKDIASMFGGSSAVYPVQDYYIGSTTDQWAASSTYRSWVIPIDDIRKVTATSNGTNGARIAFLKSYTPPADGNLPSSEYSSVTGFDELLVFGSSSSVSTKTWKVPNDAKYMYVYAGSTAGYNWKPSSIKVTGIGITEHAGDGAGFIKDDGTVDTNEYITAADLPADSDEKVKQAPVYNPTTISGYSILLSNTPDNSSEYTGPTSFCGLAQVRSDGSLNIRTPAANNDEYKTNDSPSIFFSRGNHTNVYTDWSIKTAGVTTGYNNPLVISRRNSSTDEWEPKLSIYNTNIVVGSTVTDGITAQKFIVAGQESTGSNKILKADGSYHIQRTINGESITTEANATNDINVHDGFVFQNAVQDKDGNWYSAVVIGNQVWLGENLRTTKMADGTAIASGTPSATALKYKDNPNIDLPIEKRGLLYSYGVVASSDGSIIPNWKAPSTTDFDTLSSYLEKQSRYPYLAKAVAAPDGWGVSETENAVGNDMTQNNGTSLRFYPSGSYSSSYSNPTVAIVWTKSSANAKPCISIGQNTVSLSTGGYAGGSWLLAVRLISTLTPQQFRAWYVAQYGSMQHHLSQKIKVGSTQFDSDATVSIEGGGSTTVSVTTATNTITISSPAIGESGGPAAYSHAHGNITNDGKIGSTANLPLITGANGVVTTGSFGNSANTFCEGNDSRLSDARTPSNNSDLVHITGDETITGLKTFTNGLILNDGTSWTSTDRAIPFSKSGEPKTIQYVYDNATKGLTFNPNTGELKAAKFVKRSPDNGNSGILLADGSDIPQSTFLTSFTETDPTVPDWAKAANKPSYSYSEITGTPTNVSAFTNDAGYLTSFTETDPTVPDWAKAANKPSYSYSEISNTPTDLGDFTNSAGYVKTDRFGTVYVDTAAATKAKTANVSFDYTLRTGNTFILYLKNTNSNTAATLNINSTGAKSVRINGAAPTSSNWAAGTYLCYYDGTYYQMYTAKNPYNYEDLINQPTIPTVPTNVSAFTNDAGYLTSFTETDPTVPAWAKSATKPAYNLDEVSDGTSRKLLVLGNTGTTAAAGNHTHDGVYQPVGNYLTAESNGFGKVSVAAQSTGTSNLSGTTSSATLNSDSAADTLNIATGNKWIQIKAEGTGAASTADTDKLTFGHIVPGVGTGGSLQKFNYDEAGHITAASTPTASDLTGIIGNAYSTTDTNYYPSGVSWTGGGANGPTGTITIAGGGSDVSIPAIPAASSNASGIITTGEQTIAGVKKFTSDVWLYAASGATPALVFQRGSATTYYDWRIMTDSSGLFKIDVSKNASSFTNIVSANADAGITVSNVTGFTAPKFVKRGGTVDQILLANGDNVAAGTANYYLKANGAGSAPTWEQFPTIPEVPSGAVFTDEKVKQSASTINKYGRLLITGNNTTAPSGDITDGYTGYAYYANSIMANPSTGEIVANKVRASEDLYIGSASGSQCHQQYDSVNKCLKFIFD